MCLSLYVQVVGMIIAMVTLLFSYRDIQNMWGVFGVKKLWSVAVNSGIKAAWTVSVEKKKYIVILDNASVVQGIILKQLKVSVHICIKKKQCYCCCIEDKWKM